MTVLRAYVVKIFDNIFEEEVEEKENSQNFVENIFNGKCLFYFQTNYLSSSLKCLNLTLF
jgi:hypothetical protein